LIKVRRLNHKEIVINAELIQTVESTPDTVITLTTGEKFVVEDSVDEIVEKVVSYRRSIRGIDN
jgi:flagellar protein FlbD